MISRRLFTISAHGLLRFRSAPLCWPLWISSRTEAKNDFLDYLFYSILSARHYLATLQKLYEINNGPGDLSRAFYMEEKKMKKYLIRIESSAGGSLFTTIYGDTPSRPFMIANNLWNYKTPWTAAQRLEKLAKSWEKRGRQVRRIYGSVYDMPRSGNQFNCGVTVYDFT